MLNEPTEMSTNRGRNSERTPRRKLWARCLLAMPCALGLVPAGAVPNRVGSADVSPPASENVVMAIGGSSAHGWRDPNDDSYLKRGLAAWSLYTKVSYQYDDRTVIGSTAASMDANFPGRYASWIEQDKPQLVMISWGLADDLYDKTLIPSFDKALYGEINAALQTKAVVVLVTPPVTKVLADRVSKVRVLIANEFDVAKMFHSPNVYTMNVFEQMYDAIQFHGGNLNTYYADSWHPNSLGHQFAGTLLSQDLKQTFGSAAIQFQ